MKCLQLVFLFVLLSQASFASAGVMSTWFIMPAPALFACSQVDQNGKYPKEVTIRGGEAHDCPISIRYLLETNKMEEHDETSNALSDPQPRRVKRYRDWPENYRETDAQRAGDFLKIFNIPGHSSVYPPSGSNDRQELGLLGLINTGSRLFTLYQNPQVREFVNTASRLL